MRFRKVLGCVAACVLATAAWAETTMEPGSFLVRLAPSTAALVQQVKTDKVVLDRYMRHFAMTREEVLDYLKTLKLTTTQSDGLYVVYGAPRTGSLRSRLLKLKKGTKVWVDQAGDVVLLWHCGNPVTRGPKVPYDVRKPDAQPTGVAAEQLKDVPMTAPDSMMESTLIGSVEPMLPEVPIVPVNENVIPIVPSASAPSILGWLPVLGVIGTTGGNNTPPVPEPASMAALAVGVGAIVARRRRK